MAKKWEYQEISQSFGKAFFGGLGGVDKNLVKAGEEGWELVTALYFEKSKMTKYILKREKQA